MMSKLIQNLTESEISNRLASIDHRKEMDSRYNPRFPDELFSGYPQSASVLVPMLRNEGQWEILFTRRTSSLPEHSGQVAFPGGRADPEDDNSEETALREAEEEINLSPKDVLVLGRLRELRTITNYCVQPIVGKIPWPYNFKLAKEEVSRVFTIPLEWLADPGNRRIQYRELPDLHSPIPVIYFNKYEGELLWGVSAEITLNFVETLKLDLS
jgi:8-oxo-dGTP pyrophosphatase MutT (NUDIX family)